ncbi:hypothetical protein Ciccas_011771 [Cichlidogyrus casuarinus]|uniref:Uncharacterized protein n=1 Tax=Cichlidogyrus casuarinus TaxID=1844966 RepID=A0ABD2PQ98_9PLAT
MMAHTLSCDKDDKDFSVYDELALKAPDIILEILDRQTSEDAKILKSICHTFLHLQDEICDYILESKFEAACITFIAQAQAVGNAYIANGNGTGQEFYFIWQLLLICLLRTLLSGGTGSKIEKKHFSFSE